MASISEDGPVAEQLKQAVQAKAVAAGWTQDDDDTSLAEYIVLMVANGKTQDQIAAELDGELLQDAQGAADFAAWLMSYVHKLTTSGDEESQEPVAAQQEEVPAAYENDLSENAPDNAYVRAQSRGDARLTNDSPRGPKGLHGGPRGGRGARGAQSGRGGFDTALHRTRGSDRINSHGTRGAPKGPKSNQARMANPRMQDALSNLTSQQPPLPTPQQQQQQQQQFANMMQSAGGAQLGNISHQQQMEFMAMMEQQARMLAQFMPNMIPPGMNGVNGGPAAGQNGRSMFDRVDRGGRGGRGRGRGVHMQNGNRQHQPATDNPGEDGQSMKTEGDSMETDSVALTQSSGGPNSKDPATTICYFNLRCLNKDCPYAHQSPSAPNGITFDPTTPCQYNAACKNPHCAHRHPSPALIMAHKAEQECKFWPNCTNPNCGFKHPTAPLCSFGASCTNKDCKFTHLQTKCKFNPCTNTRCPYLHEPGQSRSMAAFTWTKEQGNLGAAQQKALAEEQSNAGQDGGGGGGEYTGSSGHHVSNRKFVLEGQEEELIKPGAGMETQEQEEMESETQNESVHAAATNGSVATAEVSS